MEEKNFEKDILNNTELVKHQPKEKKDVKPKLLIFASAVFFIISIVNYSNGFDKMNNYFNDSRFPSLSINAYVGGDAYNYIINANYFVGYSVIATGSLICSILCFTSALKMTRSSN
jgi:hypothetical protein